MTLFFNYKNIEKEAKGNPFKIIDLLTQLQIGRVLKFGLRKKITGFNFLLKPEKVLSNTSVDILYIIQYISLASLRDFTLYELYGIKSLPLSYYPNLRLDSLKTNPLLEVTKSEIHFKYEE